MDIDLGDINYLAVLVAIIINMAGGAAWYGILGKPWMAELGTTKEQIQERKSEMVRGYIIAVIASIVIALALAIIIQATKAEDLDGLLIGLIAGVGFVATTFGANYAFEYRSLRLYMINAGYPLVSFAIMGTVLGLWQ